MRQDLYELLPEMVLFVAVARARNFTRAAKALGMPVSTLSRRISDFEEKLGVQLLLRSTRQVKLTDSGVSYFERCQSIVEAAEAAQAELNGQKEQPKGALRVSVTQDFALIIAHVFTEFATRYPDIVFQLDLTPRRVDLIGEGFDVAIRMGALPDSQLFARKLGSTPLGLYASPDYLKRVGIPEMPGDLARHECLRIQGPIESETLWTLHRGAQAESVSVRGRFVANSMRFLLELATHGFGIAAMDCANARLLVATGRLAQVLPAWAPAPPPVHALTPSKLLPARTRLFLDCLSDHLRMDGN